MAKRGGEKGGFWDDLFNKPFCGMFDFNGDGKEDIGEQWLAFKFFEEISKRDNTPPDDISFDFDSGTSDYGLCWSCEDDSKYSADPEDYDTEEDFDMAFEAAEDGSDMGMDSDDEYNTLVAESMQPSSQTNTIPLTLTLKFEVPGMEALNAIKKSDYPNIRKYDAAYHLCGVNQGITYIIPSNSSKQNEIDKCEFILNSDTIAAKYLTVYDGFLFAQAVKENFNVPVFIEQEDEEVKTKFSDLLMEIAEEDVELAVSIWCWCVREFGPYKQYMKDGWTLYNGIISSSDNYPKEFLDCSIRAIGADNIFCYELLTQNPQFPCYIAEYIARALEIGLLEEAKSMFGSAMINPVGKGKDKEDLINRIISCCSNWEELETMEAFKISIVPIIEKLEDKRIQRLFPQFLEEVNGYIDYVEKTSEKYQYSRRYSWRKDCGLNEYGIDPLDYETKAEYDTAICEKKYRWRRRYSSDGKILGIDPYDYETEDSFVAALKIERERLLYQRREASPKNQNEQQNQCANPLAETDMTVYTFCGVSFSGGNTVYYYRTNDETLSIGDKVIVPIGNQGKEATAEIVTVEKHRRKTAPYPVDKAKTIKYKCLEENTEI